MGVIQPHLLLHSPAWWSWRGRGIRRSMGSDRRDFYAALEEKLTFQSCLMPGVDMS